MYTNGEQGIERFRWYRGEGGLSGYVDGRYPFESSGLRGEYGAQEFGQVLTYAGIAILAIVVLSQFGGSSGSRGE